MLAKLLAVFCRRLVFYSSIAFKKKFSLIWTKVFEARLGIGLYCFFKLPFKYHFLYITRFSKGHDDRAMENNESTDEV